jgi:hypothetical protein
MKRNRLLLLVGACFVIVALWYWFRPDRLFTTRKVDEAVPTGVASQSSQPLFTGRFQGELHKTSGRASVYPTENGSKTLRLTDFRTSDGPQLHVLLVRGADVSVDKDFALDPKTSIDLGSLKGTEGDQNFVIPAGTDLAQYDVVSIYCERFHANFGIARLESF